MNDINSIVIEGELELNPSYIAPNDVPLCMFTIGCTRYYNVGDRWHKEIFFIDVIVFGKCVDYCKEHLVKGKGVRVVGRLDGNRWEDGYHQEHNDHRIIAEHVEIMV